MLLDEGTVLDEDLRLDETPTLAETLPVDKAVLDEVGWAHAAERTKMQMIMNDLTEAKCMMNECMKCRNRGRGDGVTPFP